jgi:hypothetical protein
MADNVDHTEINVCTLLAYTRVEKRINAKSGGTKPAGKISFALFDQKHKNDRYETDQYL